MVVDLKPTTDLPAEQQAIRAKCFHPSGNFVQFKKEEIEQSISDRFEKIVAQYPDRIAVKTGDRVLTFDRLNREANRVAWSIHNERGARVEPIVLISRNDLHGIISCLGIFKAGKILVVVDPSFPFERINYMIENSQAGAIVTDNDSLSFARALAKDGRRVIDIDALDSNLPSANLGLQLAPTATAQIVYSSGSTRQPKGIFFDHRRILHDVMIDINGAHICPHDRIIEFRKLTFGAGIKGLFRALLSGAAIFPYDINKEGLVKLSAFLNRERISIYRPGTSIFRRFNQLSGMEKFPSIRLIQIGGEPLFKGDVEAYKRIFSENCVLLYHLSSSEAGLLCQYFIDKETELNADVVPVGYPVEDKEIFFVDEDGIRVEGDEVGEIAVRSRYLSSGYWRNSELTRARFLPDPAGSDKRIYLTGDLGRRLPNWRLIHFGRKDFIFKVRGYRVEIGEIERALLSHPGVKEAGVAGWDREPGEKYLVGYIVASANPGPTIADLRRFLKDKLPEYMIPSAFMFLDSLPLTNGKLDRKALPEPDCGRPELETPFVAPQDPVEVQLTKIWEEVLGIQPVGVRDNFFDLGGHSLLAARLMAEIQRDLQVNLPLRFLLESPTIAQLAARIKAPQDVGSHLQEEKRIYTFVELDPRQTQTPVFCFPYLGGFQDDLLRFASLARLIGPSHAFYALKARGTDGVPRPLHRLKDMTANYIREIQTVQPQGPYFLVGECFGAAVAYETAQQLRARGEKVALLAFLDAKCRPQSLGRYLWRRLSARLRYHIDPISESWVSKSWARIVSYLREIQRLERGKRLRYFFDKTGKAIRLLFYSSRGETPWHPQWASMGGGGAERQKSKHVRRAKKAYYLTVERYRLRPYEGRITLLVNAEWYGSDPVLRWADLAAGGVEVRKIPGDHLTYITEHVPVVAKELRECLDRAKSSGTIVLLAFLCSPVFTRLCELY